MPLGEADTRAKLIDPAIHARGWTEDFIKREETAGSIEIIDGKPRRQPRGRMDYTLRLKINADSQPVALALIEAKAEDKHPGHGLQQGKAYAACKRLNVQFVFSSNGHQFVEFDRQTQRTSEPRLMAEFPTPDELRARYEQALGFKLDSAAAKPLLARYAGGEAARRYYQDASIRAVFEKMARCETTHQPARALLSLATGAGKTFIAVHLLKRIADAGQLRRALFICDRDELRAQGLSAFQAVFGSDAAEVFGLDDGSNHARNARIHIATYQSLDVDTDHATANFLLKHYPENYFSHIIIDECHRSAWGKWSQVLKLNPNAVQIGLTATPRKLAEVKPADVTDKRAKMGTDNDLKTLADNLKYFGEPVYEYDMAQGIEDGYLAACEIIRRDIFLDQQRQNERQTGIARSDLDDKTLTNAITGQPMTPAEAKDAYEAPSFEGWLILPERVRAMCKDLFDHFLQTGGPLQKTVIFCTRDSHADAVAAALGNLYAEWCAQLGESPVSDYAFKCTAASNGTQYLADLREASQSHFIATTVELLTTGVDVPAVRNIVFFKYVQSPIAFYQMVGRGTRLHPPSGKLMFRVYDYTNATRLFGEDFITRAPQPPGPPGPNPPPPPEPIIQVRGFDVRVTDAGHLILTQVDGRAVPVTVEEYKQRLAAKLVEEAPTLEQFRAHWINPALRHELLQHLPDGGQSPGLVRELEKMQSFDLYDVLAELGYGLAPRTRADRADAFTYKHADWLRGLPLKAADTLRALAAQFTRSGTEGLENQHIFETPEVERAGGLDALRELGRPADVLRDTKQRMFAV